MLMFWWCNVIRWEHSWQCKRNQWFLVQGRNQLNTSSQLMLKGVQAYLVYLQLARTSSCYHLSQGLTQFS